MNFKKSLGSTLGKYKKRDLQDLCGLVVHTTGYGPIRRWKEKPDRWASPYEAAVWLYTSAMSASPHFVADQEGRVTMLNDLDVSAWHVGSNRRKLYKNKWQWGPNGKYKDTYNWFNRQYEVHSPLELEPWRTGSPNSLTVGIEIVPPREDHTGPWYQGAWDAINAAQGVIEAYVGRKLPTYTHYQLDPIGRGKKDGAPWDPPAVAFL